MPSPSICGARALDHELLLASLSPQSSNVSGFDPADIQVDGFHLHNHQSSALQKFLYRSNVVEVNVLVNWYQTTVPASNQLVDLGIRKVLRDLYIEVAT